jgi:hypothetical protein
MLTRELAAEMVAGGCQEGATFHHEALVLRARRYGPRLVWTVTDEEDRRLDIVNPRAYRSVRDLVDHLETLAEDNSLDEYDEPMSL